MKYYCIYLKLASRLHVFVNNDKYGDEISLIMLIWEVSPFLLRMRVYLQAFCLLMALHFADTRRDIHIYTKRTNLICKFQQNAWFT